jgi:predicted MFS family arabinose efflux permease
MPVRWDSSPIRISPETVTALQTTTYNAAIAVGSLLGSVALSAGGEPAVPWAALALAAATLAHVTARRQAFAPAAAIE